MNIGRVTNAYASAHDQTRVHAVRLYPRALRTLKTHFNGILMPEELITYAQWDMVVASSVNISNPTISDDQKSASCTLQACYRGVITLRCQVTTDQSNVYNMLHQVSVYSGPWYGDEATATGPIQISVTYTP